MSAGFILRIKTCISCKQKFVAERALQRACSYKCALDVAAMKREKAEKRKAHEERKELKAAKEKIKSRQDWIKEVQQVFNAYVRERDKDLPCISSGRTTGAWDAGHYRSTGSCPELRFCELNVHKQSVHDNQHLHGNLIEYRKRLIERIGLDMVEWLEGPHEPKKWTIEQLKELKALYKQKLKELK